MPYTFRVIHSQIAATGVLNGGFDNGGGTGPPDLLLTENTPCPAPSGTRVLSNVTPEDKVTKICIYAEIVQERTLRVAKQATPQDGTSFPFTSSSDRAGSPWGAQSFSLTSGQSRSQPVQAGETVRIQEGALPADWVLSSIVCRDGTGGTSVGAEYDVANRSVRLAEVPVASSSEALTITCTFLNEKAEPEPQERTLRVLKQTASPADGMSFLFRSSSDRAGSPWGTNQAFWLGAGQSRGPEAVRPGETVEIQELALPTEWELASIVCRDGVGATVPGVVYDLAAGSARLENIPPASSDAAAPITCTFVNQEAAPPQPQERTLTVRKQTASAAGGLSFPFTSSSDRTGSPWATNPAFWLGDGQSVGPRTVVVGETIEIHEGAVPAEWELSSIDCRDGDGVALPGAVYDLASRSVRVEVAAAQSATAAAITCTFLNAEQRPQERTLTVKKQTTAAADDVSFRFTSSSDRAGSPWDTTNSFWLGDGQSLGPRTVVVGETVEIREVSLPEDWVLAAIDCRDGAGIQVPGAVYDEVDRSVRLTIPAAQSAPAIVCTFLNREADPSWTLAKTATIDGVPGDEAMPGDTIVYRVTATGVTGIVTDAMIVDDLSGVRAYATFSYATLRVDGGAPTVVPLVGATLAAGPFTLAAGQSAVLEYRVVVDEDAWLITLENEAFGLGSVPPEDCSADDRSSPDCRTTHRTPSRFWLQKLGYGINGNEPLPVAIDGAVFEVRADDGGAPGDPIDAQPASTGAAGRFDVAGIWPGSYWLSELKAPTGHALLAEPVRFTVAADGTLTVYGTHPNVAVDGSGFEVSIIDTAAYVLPETGGPGTWLFAAGGAAALAIALLAILLRRRRP
ncbi:MAG: prealbumin-like fold domain-containing protein [Leifsonia sp.]|uniref:prealbumin-like fold domain-containing protein n=1 Tax=Leifsonia sp. TaxID=1870902 RepID=UPI003F7D1810